jgi:hypothetical protein
MSDDPSRLAVKLAPHLYIAYQTADPLWAQIVGSQEWTDATTIRVWDAIGEQEHGLYEQARWIAVATDAIRRLGIMMGQAGRE